MRVVHNDGELTTVSVRDSGDFRQGAIPQAFHSPETSSSCEVPPVSHDWAWLLKAAQAEVRGTIDSLPPDLRPHAVRLPVVFERRPGDELMEDGLDPDLLGLFVGDALDVGHTEAEPLPAQILLFLENLWDVAEADEEIYRDEVQITYIHELGHYLGLDENELEARGLL
jgi:predicted Zn-dependent protease with MMP-like domain